MKRNIDHFYKKKKKKERNDRNIDRSNIIALYITTIKDFWIVPMVSTVMRRSTPLGLEDPVTNVTVNC